MKVNNFNGKQLRFLNKEFGMTKDDIRNLTRREAFGEYGLVDRLIEMSEAGINAKGEETKKGKMAGDILDVVIDMKDPRGIVLKILVAVMILPVAIFSAVIGISKLLQKRNS